jgi:hypothetical protein
VPTCELLRTSVILFIVIFSNQRAIDLKEVDLGWVEPKTFSTKYVLLKIWNLEIPWSKDCSTLFNVCILRWKGNVECRIQYSWWQRFRRWSTRTLLKTMSLFRQMVCRTPCAELVGFYIKIVQLWIILQAVWLWKSWQWLRHLPAWDPGFHKCMYSQWL